MSGISVNQDSLTAMMRGDSPQQSDQRISPINGLTDRAIQDNSVNSSMESEYRAGRHLQPPYGYRHFSNNQEAHAYINSVLNSGSGQIGTLAGGRNLTASGPSNALAQLNGRNGGITRFNNGIDARDLLHVRGPNSFLNMGRPVGLHGTLRNALQPGPTPDGCLFVLAHVDTPIRTPRTIGLFRDRSNYPSPPGSSEGSFNSISLFGSPSPTAPLSPCLSPNCRECVCHMYCEHHAILRCPVHGMGINSSDEERESRLEGSPSPRSVLPLRPASCGW